MSLIEGIARIADLVRSLARARPNRFEREMLAQAVQQDGKLYEMTGTSWPIWIRIGNKDYASQQDPSVAATYADAFQKLIVHGCVRYQSGILYVLTGTGWRLGRKYANKRREEENAG